MSLAGVDALQLLPNSSDFTAKQLVLFLCSATILGIRSQTGDFRTCGLVGTSQILDIFDS